MYEPLDLLDEAFILASMKAAGQQLNKIELNGKPQLAGSGLSVRRALKHDRVAFRFKCTSKCAWRRFAEGPGMVGEWVELR